MKLMQGMTMLMAGLVIAVSATEVKSQAATTTKFPNPVLYMTTNESYTAGGKNWVRYRYDVLNKDSYPNELFSSAPTLPPCGQNTNASRSWVDFFDQTGKRLYGFCALGRPSDLEKIWFSVEEGTVPPSYVYIEINDRQTGTKYRSNLAETVL